jgi:hypothetical protein
VRRANSANENSTVSTKVLAAGRADRVKV